MALSGVRELNPVMSIWSFSSYRQYPGCAGNGVCVYIKGEIPGRLLCDHVAIKVDFGQKTQAFLTVF